MPVFNGGEYLSAAVESILEQTYTNLKVIISDNASTDDTRDICEDFAKRDSRVTYVRKEVNVGVYRNYDAVFKGCSTSYFKWAASNDICRPTMLEKCIEILDARPDAVLAFPKTLLLDIDGNTNSYEKNLDRQESSPVQRFQMFLQCVGLNNAMSGVFRSDALRRTALNQVFYGSDISMLAELALYGKFVEIPEELFVRRMTDTSATAVQSIIQRRKFFAYEPKRPDHMHSWKFNRYLTLGVMRAPITLRDKTVLLAHIGRRMIQNRDKLASESAAYVRHRFSKAPSTKTH